MLSMVIQYLDSFIFQMNLNVHNLGYIIEITIFLMDEESLLRRILT